MLRTTYNGGLSSISSGNKKCEADCRPRFSVTFSSVPTHTGFCAIILLDNLHKPSYSRVCGGYDGYLRTVSTVSFGEYTPHLNRQLHWSDRLAGYFIILTGVFNIPTNAETTLPKKSSRFFLQDFGSCTFQHHCASAKFKMISFPLAPLSSPY